MEKKRIHDDFNIATGLFRSNKSVFAIGAVGGRSTPDAETSSKSEVKSEDDHALTAIPHGPNIEKNLFSEKPMQKRILRKVEKTTNMIEYLLRNLFESNNKYLTGKLYI